jgi:tubulin polyglutamylase TTLL4
MFSDSAIVPQVQELFASSPVPFDYMNVTEERSASRPFPLFFHVNAIITQLSKAAFVHAGFKETDDARAWNVCWGQRFSDNWQKINHFAGAFLIRRKDNFHYRMKELRLRVGDASSSFYPQSFLLPNERDELRRAFANTPIWICKPSASSRG